MKKKLMITALIILTLAWTCEVQAQWWRSGRGETGRGSGPGWWPNAQGLNLSEEQQKSIDSLYQAFRKDSASLQNKIGQKQLELNSLLLQPDPDAEKAAALQKEISDLQAQFNEKRINYQLDARKILTSDQIAQLPPGCTLGFGNMIGGYGPGYGCGYGRGGLSCGMGAGYWPRCW